LSRATRTPAAELPQLPTELDAAQTRRLIDSAGDISLLLNGDGLVLEVFSHDLELQKALQREWRGRLWVDTVTLDTRAKVSALLDAALADKAGGQRQVNHVSAAGPDWPMSYGCVRLTGQARAPTSARLVAFGRDLRDSMALQRRLVDAQQSMERDYWRFREAETRYRSLFQASAEGVLIVDGATMRIVEANPAALALMAGAGSKAPKLVGAALSGLFAPDAADPLAAALATARSVGKYEHLQVSLASSKRAVTLALTVFRQDQAAFVLVRVTPAEKDAAIKGRAPLLPSAGGGADRAHQQALAFVKASSDAVAFTDGSGRVLAVNAAFVNLAQLSAEDQARGETLDRWLGRTGIELSMLLANLREGGSTGLFSTDLRGNLGLVTEVEVAASALEAAAAPAVFAFSARDVGRRFAPSESALPTQVPASVQQLTELVGRVPLKQIVAETSDLIERLSIETALVMTKDNRAMAAQLLGLSRQSLYVKLRRFGMGGLENSDET
jgi:transcriptional regulator PpsR